MAPEGTPMVSPPKPYLGIDPSLTKTGVAFLDEHGQFDTWLITTNDKAELPLRMLDLYDSLQCLMEDAAPAVCVIEAGFSGGQGPSAWKLGAAAGALMAAVARPAWRTIPVPPAVRAKLATGKGTADKQTVLIAARERLGYRGTSFDEADALWLAVAALYLDGPGPLPWPIPKAHLAVLDKYQHLVRT